MTVAQINEFLQTPSYPQWEDGYAPNPLFDHYDCQFAIALTGIEDIQWGGRDRKVRQRELGFAEHFWSIYFSYSLVPNSH